MPLTLKRKTDATLEPVTLTETKLFTRIDLNDDDNLISGLIKAARLIVEDICRRSLINTTWQYYLDEYPACDMITLPMGLVSSITHVKYYDEYGVLQTQSASTYNTDYISEPSRIVLKESESWPTTEIDRINTVEIEFIAGYGSSDTAVPEAIKLAIKQIVAHWYNMRETHSQFDMKTVPMSAEYILTPYRVLRFF